MQGVGDRVKAIMLKDILKNDIGQYDPEAEKLGWKGVILFFLGIIISIVIPVLFVYLEAWEITVNLGRLIWDEAFGLRTGYFILFCLANISLLIVCMLTTYRINGRIYRLRIKKAMRFIAIFLYIIVVILYIISLVV